jgi:hypothetical protein
MRKKAQMSGTNAATLVLIIAGLILLYILFIPPAERQKLLEEEEEEKEEAEEILEEIENRTLLYTHPGTLLYTSLAGKERQYDLPTLVLKSGAEAEVIKKLPALVIEKSLFSEKIETVSFDIEKPENVQSMLLSFNIKESSGILIIKVNGKELYSNRIETANIEPITISKTNLVEGENTVEFSVSSPKLKFWHTNRYILENMQITATIEQIEQLTGMNSFYLTRAEANNVQQAKLRMTPECKVGQVGKLQVRINGVQVFGAIPDCGVTKPIIVDPSYIEEGQNNMEFTSERGNYIIDNVRLNLEYKELTHPTYYFDIETDLYNEIEKGKIDINMEIIFVDDGERKQVELVLNNNHILVDQEQPEYTEDIKEWVREGKNVLKLIPQADVDILDLKIEVS